MSLEPPVAPLPGTVVGELEEGKKEKKKRGIKKGVKKKGKKGGKKGRKKKETAEELSQQALENEEKLEEQKERDLIKMEEDRRLQEEMDLINSTRNLGTRYDSDGLPYQVLNDIRCAPCGMLFKGRDMALYDSMVNPIAGIKPMDPEEALVSVWGRKRLCLMCRTLVKNPMTLYDNLADMDLINGIGIKTSSSLTSINFTVRAPSDRQIGPSLDLSVFMNEQYLQPQTSQSSYNLPSVPTNQPFTTSVPGALPEPGIPKFTSPFDALLKPKVQVTTSGQTFASTTTLKTGNQIGPSPFTTPFSSPRPPSSSVSPFGQGDISTPDIMIDNPCLTLDSTIGSTTSRSSFNISQLIRTAPKPSSSPQPVKTPVAPPTIPLRGPALAQIKGEEKRVAKMIDVGAGYQIEEPAFIDYFINSTRQANNAFGPDLALGATQRVKVKPT